MPVRTLLFALCLVMVFPACQKSEISDAPAAEVSDTQATTDTATATSADAGGATTANVIKEKSSIDFVGAKVTRDHKGKFHNFDGRIEYAGGVPQLISFDIDLNSIETDTPDLTKHLKSPDFFDVARYPKATFTSKALSPAPAGSDPGVTHILTGTL